MFFNLSQKKKLKLAFLFLYIIISCIFVLLSKVSYLLSIIIVFVPPTIVNFLWLKKSREKIFVFSISATLLFAFAVELVSRLANSWDVASILPRLFGIMPLENILFAFINFFFVLSFYEYFVDKDSSKKISKNFKFLIIILALFSAIIFLLFSYKINVAMSYFLVAIITLLVPSIMIFFKRVDLLKKTILPTLFFAVVFFVYELVSLKIRSWWWPGKYLITVTLFNSPFPIDDVIIWYFLSTIALIGIYEFFMDDYK